MKMKAQERWIHPGPQPNGLQADKDFLWAIDQTDNHLYKLSYEDGSIIEIPAKQSVHWKISKELFQKLNQDINQDE